MKIIYKTIMVVTIALGLSAVTAYAGPPNTPPKDSGRDVIGDASKLCKFENVVLSEVYAPAADLGIGSDPEIFDLACGILWKSDGALIEAIGCEPVTDDPDNGFVKYTLRNCHKNEAALQRQAASVVLSMDDVIARYKSQQALTAAEYACGYAGKAYDLEGVGKFDDGDYEDLAVDAESIAYALGYPCE